MNVELTGFASLPADTFADGSPAGADNGSGEPIDANGRTGPFDGQPVQGFSGVQFAPDGNGAFWFLSDNGFGAKENSTDYLLRLYQVEPNFAGAENGDGNVEIQGFVQLADPDNFIPSNIVNEDSEDRLLTGGDFDIESFVIDNNGDIWVGDEFGPYLLHFDSTGKLLEAPIPTPNVTDSLNTLNGQEPLVIGHRGASGILPEHTLEAYQVAIAQGADFIEPDLVITKDGVLIARHEPLLDDTTNVAEVFGEDRKSTKILDGVETTGYFAEDFTLAEIKQLRAVQSRDFRSQDFNGAFEIPTFQEVIELVQEVEAQTGKQIGIYPETKHPTFFDLQDLSLEEPLIETLQETGFTDPNRIFIQSFEFQNLIELQGMLDAEGLGDIPLVQLYGDTTEGASPDDGFSVPYDIRYNLEQGNDLAAIYGQDFLDAVENGLSENTTYRDLDNAEILQIISDKYAEGAGPWKNNFLLRESLDEPVDSNGDGVAEITTQLTGEVTSFIKDAHAAGLQVHPYTLRDEERFLTLKADGTPQTPEEEFQQMIELGIDGFFTDFPGTGAAIVNSLTGDFVRSPQNPNLGDGIPNLSRSRGFEGMAFSVDRTKLYPLLEGVVEGDPDDALRIYEFDVTQGEYTGLVGFYQTEIDGNPIGDFTPINNTEFLVIERDNNQGEEAEFKKIFKIDISNIDADGYVEKELVVDLLDIQDPNDLNGDGSTTFDFPFVTIEDVLVIDENTILVANDNNYPFSQGREGDIDNNEIILLELEQPLNLDPSLGGNAITPTLIELESNTTQPAQMTGLNGYKVNPIFTVGEQINDYAPPGILDGLGAFAYDEDTVRVFANHELRAALGYTYTLANGTELTGARVSYFDINKETRELEDAGLAYDTIINRAGEVVDEASDLEFEGINRLCSAQYIEAHQFGDGRGLEDAMFFTGEETSGGTEFVIDPATNTMYAVPWMGRAAWESTTELDTGTTDKVALLIGDDREAAPLLLYVGEKDNSNPDDFLARNGLKGGKLYTWVPDSEVGDTPTFLNEDGEAVDEDNAPDPFGFNGTGNSLSGTWVELDFYRPDLAGKVFDVDGDGTIQDELGYDDLGFATQAMQDRLFIDAGGFQFSRPEDVSTNPEDGTVAVMASTGRDNRFTEDKWGTTYKIDVDFGEAGEPLTAQIDILYDGDDAGNGQFEGADFGLRSPDNLDWADDGQIYLQEDRSFSEFGLTSGEEASIWRLDPDSGELTRVAQMDRSAVPEGQTDGDPTDIGDWESSGILDVSTLFDEEPGNLFIFDVQAHSLTDGIIGAADLVQGGQLAFLNKEEMEKDPVYIGETTALIPQAGSSYAPEHLQDGGSGDTDFPYGNFKALATVGEIDPDNGHVLTGYPDGQAAWLLDEDTIRVAYQSESYGTLTSSEGETYSWVMDNGATFTGSHVHTIDYDRASFADFLNNDSSASEMFQGAGHLFSTVYNVFGEEVTGKNYDPTDLGAKWGNQTLADGTVVDFNEDQQLTFADWFFHSFCGAYYEQTHKYGEGIGFEDNVWLMAEEWNIGQLYEEAALAAGMTEEEARLSPGEDFFTQTMGLASMVVDVENETAYTVPVLGQGGYEKLLPLNSGHEDYVVLVTAGYNLEIEPMPMTIYIGKKGVDADGNPLAEDANERDSFLGRNGLLYGQLYGMAATDETYASLGIEEVDADIKMLDAYAQDADAANNFSVRYLPTSYQWDGFDTPENANETEIFRWEQDGDTLEDGTVEANEQPDGYTYFNGDSKTEHPAVDPDSTKHRFVQNLTVPSAQLGVEFSNIIDELENNDADGNGLPDYLSADVTRILAGVDGSLTLETGGKGNGHIGPNNPDGTLTHATHLEDGEARMDQPDGLQWIKASDGDYLIVDEDSGNDYGERKYVLPIDSETLQLEEEGTGYFLASTGGSLNPRATAEVAAIPDTFTRATSSEFSGSWNVTHLVQTKEDGSFYTQEEIAGTGAEEIIQQYSLEEQTLIGVVQHRGESSGIIEELQADQGGQIFMFNIDISPETDETPEPNFSSLEGDFTEVTGSNGLVFTGAGDDLIDASLSGGNNRIYAGGGNDTVILGAKDYISGAVGDDIFYANSGGDNTITGGEGEDQFWIAVGEIPESANTITDFTAGEDVIGIVLGISFDDLSLTQDGDNTLIAAGGNDLATLLGVESTSLSTDNFAFV